MRILIDTHVLLWYLNGDEKLSPSIISILEDDENQIAISVVSLWEFTIKFSLGKLKLKSPITLDDIKHYIESRNVDIVNIDLDSLVTLFQLPYHEDHSDPFDRMLIAQSMTKNFTVISVDKHFKFYQINLIS